mmetsp:Transcript_35633/g.53611  ORF Transcript_35633/g.53611 Transcript_35633/m.53611 type:complete len:213 (+) Transcript_35633:93-731(+)
MNLMGMLTFSAIALVAATTDIDPGVAISSARLRNPFPRNHKLRNHVVLETARWLSAVHHTGQAILHTSSGLLGEASILHVKIGEASRAMLTLRTKACWFVGALQLCEFHQLMWAFHPGDVKECGVVLAGSGKKSGSREADAMLPGVFAERSQGVSTASHGSTVLGVFWQGCTGCFVVNTAIFASPGRSATREHAPCSTCTGVESTSPASSDL